MPPALEIITVKFLEANVQIASPKNGVVGSGFRVHGMASVLMRQTEFIKQGGQGTKTVEEFFVSQGLRIAVEVDGGKHDVEPQVQADHTLRWSHDVSGGTAGHEFKIKVNLTGSVQESEVKRQNDKETSSSSHVVGINKSATISVRVDSDPPQLKIGAVDVPKGPPYVARITGTAQDTGTSVRSLRASVDGGGEVLAQSLSQGFASWEVKLPLPDRATRHTVRVTAEDELGNTSEDDVTVEADETSPKTAIEKPTSPHLPTFEEGGIVVTVEGLTFDQDSKITAVQWRLDSGPINDAEDVGEDFAMWRLEANIDDPSNHVVTVTAIDAAGNVSEPAVLKIEPVLLRPRS